MNWGSFRRTVLTCEEATMVGGSGDDPAALRAELTQMLPSLRETLQWRSSVGKALENEVQELANAKMSLMGDITGLQTDVASLRRELSAYDTDLKNKLNLSEKGLLAHDKELKGDIVEVKGQIEGVKGAVDQYVVRLGTLEASTGDLRAIRATVNALQAKVTTIDDVAHRLGVTEAAVSAAGVNWPGMVSRIESLERGGVGVGGQGLEQRFNMISKRLDDVDLRVAAASSHTGDDRAGSRGDRAARSFLPEKARMPKTYGGKLEEWPDWKSDVEIWFDGCAKGLGVTLSRLAMDQSDEPIDGLFISRFHDELVTAGTNPMEVMGHDSRVYEALKGMTDNEALATVRGVTGGRGFEAWRRICQQFEPGVAAARHGAFHRVTAMGEKPAKNTMETRRLLVELDNRLRVAREVQGREVADDLSNAVLEKMLDPTTRAFTGSHFGKPYAAYRREVMRFLNENMSTDVHMQIGAVTNEAAYQDDPNDEAAWGDTDGNNLAAIKGACWTCGVVGHAARDCPLGGNSGKGGKGKGYLIGQKGAKGAPKGKGKNPGPGKGGGGKGGGPTGGKGKSAPPRDGCLICWGPHWARECPQRTYCVDHSAGVEAWSTQGASASVLCNLRTVAPKKEEFECTDTEPAQCEPRGRWRGGRWRDVLRGGLKKDRDPRRRASKEPGKAAMITGAKYFQWISEESSECAPHRCTGCMCGGVSRDADRFEDGEFDAQKLAPTKVEDCPSWKFAGSKPKASQKGTADGNFTDKGRVSTLTVIEPEGEIQAVIDDEWELVEAAVDSGATENVMSEKTLQSVKTTEGESSRRGVSYEVANGVRIPNLGEKRFVAISSEGVAKGLTCQICEVNRPLLSVSKIVNAGHKVVFTGAGSWIEDEKTGEVMALKEDGGMYTLQMWVRAGVRPVF